MSYSDELTAKIVDEYTKAPSRETVDAIAARIGKSSRSVTAKLAAEGVYITPVRTTKTGEAIVKKEELVADIEEWLQIDAPSLAKTSKPELKRLYNAIKELYDSVNS